MEAEARAERLAGWLAGWARLAAEQARGAAGGALAGETGLDALWRAAEAQAAFLRHGASLMVGEARSAPGAAALARLLDPAAWTFGPAAAPEPGLRRLIDGPPPEELGQFGRAALPETPEWRALRRARARHRGLALRAWRRLAQRLAEEPLERLTLERWAALAGEAQERLHASPRFRESQRALLTAAVALREREQAMVAEFCEGVGLPRRDEVDALHHGLAALRRELRSLKRELGRP